MASPSSEFKPQMDDRWPVPHVQKTYDSWKNVQKLIEQGHLVIDGTSLDSAGVMAVARLVNYVLVRTIGDLIYLRHECVPRIKQSDRVIKGVEDIVSTLHNYLSKGYFLYGICLAQPLYLV